MSSILELNIPAQEPVSVADVVAFLKIQANNPDISRIVPKLMKAARRQIETWTGLTLAQRKFVQYQDGFPFFPYFQSPYAPLFGAAFPFYFGYGPIASYPYPAIGGLQNQMLDPFTVVSLRKPVTGIDGVNYIGTDGKKHALVPFRDFIPDFSLGRICPLPGQRWPVSIVGANSVEIYFTAGYAPDGTTQNNVVVASPGWVPFNSYAQYSYLIDPNGNVQMQTAATGTSGSIEPAWPTNAGDTVGDNNLSWTCLGQISGDYDLETEYSQYAVVYDGNDNLQTLVASNLLTGTTAPSWATTLGGLTDDAGQTGAWRCLGPYQGVMPAQGDQPNSYSRVIACPEDLQVAIMILTSHYYYNREPVAASAANEVPFSLKAIVDSLRDYGFMVPPTA